MQRIRSLAFLAVYGLSILLTSIIAAPVVMLSPKCARPVAKFWAQTMLPVLKFMTGVSHRIEGAENMPDGPAIVAVNHQSQWETIALYALLPKPVMVMKKELLKIPLYGWWMKRLGNISVDREGGARALRALRREAQARIAQGEQIVVFPEGTRSPVGSRRPFHPGVVGIYASVNAPCVPVAHNSGEYWRYPGPDKMHGEIALRFLKPIAPGLDRRTFLQTLRETIEGARPDLAAAKADGANG